VVVVCANVAAGLRLLVAVKVASGNATNNATIVVGEEIALAAFASIVGGASHTNRNIFFIGNGSTNSISNGNYVLLWRLTNKLTADNILSLAMVRLIQLACRYFRWSSNYYRSIFLLVVGKEM
jgi:hypothetical protein